MPRRPHRFSFFALTLALVFALAPPLHAQSSVTAQHLTVSLLIPPAQLAPGETFTAGLDFKLEEGWHVYWINAGDSGEPPAAKWNLPAGVTADALQFPAPKRLPLGPLMDFGYENEVVFPVPMHVSAAFHPTATKTNLAAHVTWLVCREVCIPGKADLAVTRTAWSKPAASPDVDPAAQ
ncbi:MAG: protein-disulfide reductase DsbD domain-containing protein, partial [Acidobacteriaceae bacterium]